MKKLVYIYLLLLMPALIMPNYGLGSSHDEKPAKDEGKHQSDNEEKTEKPEEKDDTEDEENIMLEEGVTKFDEKLQRKIDQALDGLEKDDPIVFEYSVYFFERMGKSAIPTLSNYLRNNKDNQIIRKNVIYTFGRIGENAEKAIPLISTFLRNEDSDTRAISAKALGKIGKGSKDTVPLLAQLQYDPDEWVSTSAKEALKKIGTVKALSAIKEYEEKTGKTSTQP